MAAPYLDPYIPPFKPLTNITPFTYKDGETYLEVLERMREYLNDEIIDFINTNFTQLGDDFETQVNELITAVNEAIQSVIESSAEAQDAIVAELLENDESLTRVAADEIYAGQVTNAAIAAIVTAVGATKTALDSAYLGQVTDAAINAIVEDTESDTKATLDGYYAGQVTNAVIAAIVTATGATKTALDSAYLGQVTDAAVAAILEDEESDSAAAVIALSPPVSLTSPDESMEVNLSDVYIGFSAGDPLTTGTGILLLQAAPGVYLPYVVADLGLTITGDPSGAGININMQPTIGQVGVIPAGGSALSDTATFISLAGVKFPAFETEDLPSLSGVPDGYVVYNLTDQELNISISGAWESIGGGGGGYDPTIVADVAIGISAAVPEDSHSVAIGFTANGSTGTGAVAIGEGASTLDDDAIAIGHGTYADGPAAIAIGNNANSSAGGAMIGDGNNSDPDAIRFGYDKINFASGSAQLEVSATDSNSLVYNGWIISGLFIIDSIPPVGADLQIGTMAWEFTMGIPLWLKSVETDPLDNVWVDATGTTVYPLP